MIERIIPIVAIVRLEGARRPRMLNMNPRIAAIKPQMGKNATGMLTIPRISPAIANPPPFSGWIAGAAA